jgi:hypothetical protein
MDSCCQVIKHHRDTPESQRDSCSQVIKHLRYTPESQRDSASQPGVGTTPGMKSTDFYNPERVVDISGDR